MDQGALVERASRGDHDAFGELVGARLARLDTAARLILRDAELARDAVQEATLRAWRNLRGLRDPDRFDAWLHRLTVNACLDLARQRQGRIVEIQLTPLHDPPIPDASARVTDADYVSRMLGAIDPAQRAVIVLHYYLDLSLPETAAALGIPLGTAKSRLNRALDAMRIRVAGEREIAFAGRSGGSIRMNDIDREPRSLTSDQLNAALSDAGGSDRPTYLDDIVAQARRSRQRPAWTFPERWLPMTLRTASADTAPPMRMALILVILMLMITLIASAAIVGSQLLRNGPDQGLPAAAMLPTACPPGTVLKSGDIATVAGTGATGYTGDGGPATAATLGLVVGGGGDLAFGSDGTLYLSDPGNGVIRTIDAAGTIRPMSPATPDGDKFVWPVGLAVGTTGDLYVADMGDGDTPFVYRVDPAGARTVVAGTGVSGVTGDGGPATAAEIQSSWVATGPDGRLYIAEPLSVRVIDGSGTITTVAGTGHSGFAGDGGPATAAQFGAYLEDVVVDDAGDIFVTDPGNHRIRRIDPAGIITTIAGTGKYASSGDAGPATAADIIAPGALALDGDGGLVFTDYIDQTVRRIDSRGIITTLAGHTLLPGFRGDCGPASSALLSAPAGIAVRDGVIYFSDTGNDRIRMIVP